jgi:hypothetical protein
MAPTRWPAQACRDESVEKRRSRGRGVHTHVHAPTIPRVRASPRAHDAPRVIYFMTASVLVG